MSSPLTPALTKVPRVKDAYDWLLTWSPEEEVTDKKVPYYIKWFLDREEVERFYCVLEKHKGGKWHLHAYFRYVRSYNSDYKWWKDEFKEHGLEAPALDITYCRDPITTLGGYLTKDGNEHQVLGSKGISDEQLAVGADKYKRRLRRQAIRKTLDDHIIIQPDKIPVAVGSYMARTGCSRDEALIGLARDGFAFRSADPRVYEMVVQREESVWPSGS